MSNPDFPANKYIVVSGGDTIFYSNKSSAEEAALTIKKRSPYLKVYIYKFDSMVLPQEEPQYRIVNYASG